MIRSQRRAAVARRAIAAGLLCAGLGTVATAPAVADTGDDTGGAVASNNSKAGRGGQTVRTGALENAGPRTRRPGRVPAGPTDDRWHPDPDWCHIVLPVWWTVPPSVYYRNRNVFILPQAPVTASPPTLVAGVAETGAHASTDVAGAAAADVAGAAVTAPNALTAAPAGLDLSGPPAPVARLDAPAPPASPPALPESPESVAPEPVRLPPPLPDLPSLGRIAAVALPGLAGIAALTALGGILGYRQAKAGYVLRAAGTARFLR